MIHRATILAFVAVVTASCDKSYQFEEYREKVRAEMRDPASAEFRNEKVRTLWTEGGQRVRFYCAEVNGANAFGGKTGFLPVRYIISAKSPNSVYEWALASDPLWLDQEKTNNYYLACEREDTQRSDENFARSIIDPYDPVSMDKYEPVLSNLEAPEER